MDRDFQWIKKNFENYNKGSKGDNKGNNKGNSKGNKGQKPKPNFVSDDKKDTLKSQIESTCLKYMNIFETKIENADREESSWDTQIDSYLKLTK